MRGGASLSTLLACTMLGTSLGGSLGGFEEAVAKPHASSSAHSSYDGDEESPLDELFGGCLVATASGCVAGVFLGIKWLVYDWWAEPDEEPLDGGSGPESAKVSLEEEPEASGMLPEKCVAVVPVEDRFSGNTYLVDEGQATNAVGESVENIDEAASHRLGTAAMPYARIDCRWQYLDSDTDARDLLVESGYKYLAFYGRFTRYEDRAAKERLDVDQYYGLIRIGDDWEGWGLGSAQIGLGAGAYIIRGNREQSGPALTLPVVAYPADWFGVEFRPAWTRINDRTIGDYDISASTGYRFFQVRAGYRWCWVQGEGHWLNGPYAGITAMF